jgi:hypothetical protein
MKSIMNCICPIFDTLFSADYIGKILLLIITAVITFFVGILLFRYKYKKESRIRGSYGYFTHLIIYISRLRHLISTENIEGNQEPLYGTWFLLYPENELRGEGNQNYGNALKDLSKEFTAYLCRTIDQVPPKANITGQEWIEKLKSLQNYLNHFSDIGSRPHSEYKNKSDIDAKWKELVDILKWIEEKGK